MNKHFMINFSSVVFSFLLLLVILPTRIFAQDCTSNNDCLGGSILCGDNCGSASQCEWCQESGKCVVYEKDEEGNEKKHCVYSCSLTCSDGCPCGSTGPSFIDCGNEDGFLCKDNSDPTPDVYCYQGQACYSDGSCKDKEYCYAGKIQGSVFETGSSSYLKPDTATNACLNDRAVNPLIVQGNEQKPPDIKYASWSCNTNTIYTIRPQWNQRIFDVYITPPGETVTNSVEWLMTNRNLVNEATSNNLTWWQNLPYGNWGSDTCWDRGDCFGKADIQSCDNAYCILPYQNPSACYRTTTADFQRRTWTAATPVYLKAGKIYRLSADMKAESLPCAGENSIYPNCSGLGSDCYECQKQSSENDRACYNFDPFGTFISISDRNDYHPYGSLTQINLNPGDDINSWNSKSVEFTVPAVGVYKVIIATKPRTKLYFKNLILEELRGPGDPYPLNTWITYNPSTGVPGVAALPNQDATVVDFRLAVPTPPPPDTLTHRCDPTSIPNTWNITLSWLNRFSSANRFAVRVDSAPNSWVGTTCAEVLSNDPDDKCLDTTTTSYLYQYSGQNHLNASVEPNGQNSIFNWWVHACADDNCSPLAPGGTFSCCNGYSYVRTIEDEAVFTGVGYLDVGSTVTANKQYLISGWGKICNGPTGAGARNRVELKLCLNNGICNNLIVCDPTYGCTPGVNGFLGNANSLTEPYPNACNGLNFNPSLNNWEARVTIPNVPAGSYTLRADEVHNAEGTCFVKGVKTVTVTQSCGDGVINGTAEQCDNGNLNGVICAAAYDPIKNANTCTYCDSSCNIQTATNPWCGDGIIKNPEEVCDDGNTISGNGACSADCQHFEIYGNYYQDNGAGYSGGDRCISSSNLSISLQNPSISASQGPNTYPGSTNSNNYSINTGINPGPFTVTLDLHNQTDPANTYSCSCPGSADPFSCKYQTISPSSDALNFYLVKHNLSYNGWWQVIGGNIFAGSNASATISSPIPGSPECLESEKCFSALMLWDLAENEDSPGIPLTRGSGINSIKTDADDDANKIHFERQREQADSAFAADSTVDINRQDYQYFHDQLNIASLASDCYGLPNMDAVDFTSGETTVCQVSSLTINESHNWQLSSDQSLIVFVDGNLTIDANNTNSQVVSVAEGGYLAFIVSGDIIISNHVGYNNPAANPSLVSPNVEGVYVADGNFVVQSNSPNAASLAPGDSRISDYKLIGAGTFVGWSGIEFSRDYSDGSLGKENNNSNPTEVFIFRPDFVVNTPGIMKDNLKNRHQIPPTWNQ